jgi:hypothetical protein
MIKKTYSEKLLDPRWQKKRLEILQRDNWTCRMCEETKLTLHIHHDKYCGSNPWEIDSKFLKTICRNCHMIIHHVKSMESGVVIHIEKKDGVLPNYEYEVYLKTIKNNGIAFYKITENNEAEFVFGFYKSAIDRFSTILNFL